MNLHAAADFLDALATGRTPPASEAIPGALALQTLLTLGGDADRDLLDAAAGLESHATGSPLDLNNEGRARAAELATKVRGIAELIKGSEPGRFDEYHQLMAELSASAAAKN